MGDIPTKGSNREVAENALRESVTTLGRGEEVRAQVQATVGAGYALLAVADAVQKALGGPRPCRS